MLATAFMIGLIISAALLCLIMFVMAKDEAEIHFGVVLLIVLGVSVLSAILSRTIGLFSIPIVFGALAWALQQFCTLRWSKAILITLVYVAASVGLSYVF